MTAVLRECKHSDDSSIYLDEQNFHFFFFGMDFTFPKLE